MITSVQFTLHLTTADRSITLSTQEPKTDIHSVDYDVDYSGGLRPYITYIFVLLLFTVLFACVYKFRYIFIHQIVYTVLRCFYHCPEHFWNINYCMVHLKTNVTSAFQCMKTDSTMNAFVAKQLQCSVYTELSSFCFARLSLSLSLSHTHTHTHTRARARAPNNQWMLRSISFFTVFHCLIVECCFVAW